MEDGGYRTNQRLECFFKRTLGQGVSDALRISEPCIIVGENYGHAFKFVALTDSKLFILANPPQTDQDIELTIELQCITEINNVHDIPDFLSGELQRNVQHFMVRFVKQAVQKLQGSSLSSYTSTSSQRSSSDSRNHVSFNTTILDTSMASDNLSAVLNENRRHLSCNDVFGDSVENESSSIIHFKSDDFLQPESRNRSNSDPSSNADFSADAKSFVAVPVRFSAPQTLPYSYSTPALASEGSPRSIRSRPLPPPPPGTEKTNALTKMNRRRKGNERGGSRGSTIGKTVLKYNTPEPHFEKYAHAPSRVSILNKHGKSEHIVNDSESNSPLNEDKNANRFLQSSSNQGLSASFSARIGSLFGKADDKLPEKELSTNLKADKIEDDALDIGKSEVTLDIYLINGDSKLTSLLRTTRVNHIIALTLERSNDKEKSSSSASSKILEEFHQLKEEIIKCNEIENAFIFTKELLAGCRKRPFIKKLFWKTDELLNYYIKILDEYISNGHEITMRGDEADQLDFMLIIAELIITMIFNTEILPSRNKILFGHRGSAIIKMLKIALARPGFLKKKESLKLSNAASLLLSGVDHQQKANEKEVELNYLLGEWADVCSSLVYDLLNAAEQCTWMYYDGKGISVHNLINIMDHHANIESFMDELIQRILHKFAEDKVVVKRADILLVFKQFSLLKFIFENSSRLSNYLVEKYYEEFRYYIGSPQFISRIPDCPLFSILSTVITDVSLLVINHS